MEIRIYRKSAEGISLVNFDVVSDNTDTMEILVYEQLMGTSKRAVKLDKNNLSGFYIGRAMYVFSAETPYETAVKSLELILLHETLLTLEQQIDRDLKSIEANIDNINALNENDSTPNNLMIVDGVFKELALKSVARSIAFHLINSYPKDKYDKIISKCVFNTDPKLTDAANEFYAIEELVRLFMEILYVRYEPVLLHCFKYGLLLIDNKLANDLKEDAHIIYS